MSAIDNVLAVLEGVKPDGPGKWKALCKAHADDKPSLSIKETADGKVLLNCRAGCATADVVAAYGMTMADLFASNGNSKGAELVVAYDYVDESGKLLYQNCRLVPKDFFARRPNGRGGWLKKMDDTRRVLFHLPQLVAGVAAGQTVYLCEGEKDVLAVEKAGAYATTKAFGAKSKWLPEYSEFLRGAKVIIIAHKDAPNEAGVRPGYEVATREAKALQGVAASVEIVETPVEKAGADAADHLGAGKTLAELVPADPDAEAPSQAASLPIYSVPDLLAMHIPKLDYLVGPPIGLARGTVGELDAYPKCGKTRFMLDACWAVRHSAPFLEAPTEKAKVLYLTEEWLITWRQALEDSHLLGECDDGFTWMSLITAQQSGLTDWGQFCCEQLRAYCVSHEIGVLSVDTVARWAGIQDENDAPQMAAAIMPLRKIAAEGIAVLVLRHDRKGGGLLGESGRGSSSATGEVDYILHLQKKAGSGETTARQREFEGVSRLSGETGKLIVELNESGHYELVGAKGDVMVQRAKEYIRGVLPADEAEAWTLKELAVDFAGSDATLTRALNELCRDGEVTSLRRAGHAVRSKSSQTLGYWQGSARQQKGFDLDGE